MNQLYTVSVFDTTTGKHVNVEVSKEVFDAYRQSEWNEKDHNRAFYAHEIQFSGLLGGENGALERFHEFVDKENITERTAFRNMDIDALRRAKSLLTEQEQKLLYLLFEENQSQTKVAKTFGVSQQCISKRTRSVLCKLTDVLGVSQK